jgi:GNAT superfamily N-acetyltransferase
MLHFEPLSVLHTGDIYAALKLFYGDYPDVGDGIAHAWHADWREYDRLVFANIDTVGKAGFASFVGDEWIGFCSWDPRRAPDMAIIGHNGVFPAHRGNGYGVAQIVNTLEIFRAKGYRNAVVTTGAGEFFVPAQKMYVRLGFAETDRAIKNGFPIINYCLRLFP